MTTNDDRKMKQILENIMMRSHGHQFSKTMNSKRVIWIIIHLQLELRKISYEIDSIFVTQMSVKMACYFGWLVFDARGVFYAILRDNYVQSDKIMSAAINLLWFFHNVAKFLLINYVCETVSAKASATGDLINRLLYSTCDIEVRETILWNRIFPIWL
ncbi:PREDICTED: uncharacterized protein LOC105562320 isoform X2 [Vollenhovia emeryi]|uniref:uncharacterized protein LOC105562320 isoform X2 n=1 Tax=Vollenhovia emeryi TaxID=411798 RepID=UPI0005F4300F|nr:PREDICTED: uncharacterized protein LOC105562320 isoform X2 [Vollenhovia emeryi]